MFRIARGLALFTVGMGSLAWSQARLSVRVWNYAGVSSEVIRQAEHEVDKVFGSIGAQFDWIDCDPNGVRPATCAATPGPADLVLRIEAKSAAPGTFGADVLGRAMGDAIADVYDSEVAAIARRQNLARYEVYAMAIAHEFGHLLLGPGAHTGTGLMRSRWTSDDFDAAAKRRLRFDTAQNQRIRSAVQARSTFAAVPKRQSQP